MIEVFRFDGVRKNAGGVSIERTLLASDESYQLHGHDYYEIFFITNGSVVHKLNNEPDHLPMGSMCLIRPGDVHSLRRAGSNGEATLINVAFSADLLIRLCPFADQYTLRKARLSSAEQQFLLHQIDSLKRCSQTDAALVHSVSCAIILTAFSLLMMHGGRKADSPPSWLEYCMTQACQPENFTVGLRRLVELSGVSQEHLSREMRRYYDLTPSQYINQLRLEHACMLLRTTVFSVTEIVLRCGFCSISYFNCLFRETYGCTPVAYRKSLNVSGPRQEPNL